MAEIIVLKVAQTITIQNNELVSPVKKKNKNSQKNSKLLCTSSEQQLQ